MTTRQNAWGGGRHPITAGLLALLLTVMAGTTQARTFQGEYVAFGVGTLPCSQYSAARVSGGGLMVQMSRFIEGYLSAFNLIVPNTYDILAGKDIAEAYQWLDRHCRANPEMSLTDAVASLTVYLYPNRSNLRQPPGR